MAAPIVLHYTSAHPMNTKRAVLNGEIQRAIRVSSDQLSAKRSLSVIARLFAENGYPSDIINRSIKNNLYKLNVDSRKSKNKTIPNNQIFMRLPYINDTIVRRVNGILRGAKAPIKAVWINDNSLQKMLISSALTTPPCPSGNKKCHTCENGLQGRYITKKRYLQNNLHTLWIRTAQRNLHWRVHTTHTIPFQWTPQRRSPAQTRHATGRPYFTFSSRSLKLWAKQVISFRNFG